MFSDNGDAISESAGYTFIADTPQYEELQETLNHYKYHRGLWFWSNGRTEIGIRTHVQLLNTSNGNNIYSIGGRDISINDNNYRLDYIGSGNNEKFVNEIKALVEKNKS